MGEFCVYLQYTIDRKIAMSTTGVWVKESDWDQEMQKVKSSNPYAARLNGVLRSMMKKVDDQIIEYQADPNKKRLTIHILRQMVKGTYDPNALDDVDFLKLVKEALEKEYKTQKLAYATYYNALQYMNTFEKIPKDAKSCDSSAKIDKKSQMSPHYRHFLKKKPYFCRKIHRIMQYSKTIIGRHHEQDILQMCYDSNKAEFIAVYGRRRIGKTYLVKQYFDEKFDFFATGVYQASRSEQLRHWQEQLKRYSGEKRNKPKDWTEAFAQLQEYIESLGGKDRVLIFLDELPWFDTPKSGFLRALDLFWNGWASNHREVKLIVCGSATTWMTNKLLGDKGGLHNRVTRPLHLVPFTLLETEEYLKSMDIEWSRQEVLDTYMILGGTPFYISLLRPDLSLTQNVDELFFSGDAVLRTEYSFLFKSLFNEAALYRRVVELISSTLIGMTRQQIVKSLKVVDNGNLTEALDNLVKCDFLRRYQTFGKKEYEPLYQLTDMYTLFYLRFVKNNNGQDEHAWSTMSAGQKNAWTGYAFEQVCILHTAQIKRALGIPGIASDICSWYYSTPERKAQIDLIIDRSDKNIDLCEMQYSDHEYELKKDYVEYLQERRELFREATKTTKTLRLTLIASAGIKQGKHNSALQGKLSAEELFT